jgi:hypothetical protein
MKSPIIRKSHSFGTFVGYVIRFDSTTGVWYWTGDGWSNETYPRKGPPKYYPTIESAQAEIQIALDYIHKWKPGWID